MKLLAAFRHFLFPFEQDSLEVPEPQPAMSKYRYLNRHSDEEAIAKEKKFEASDCFIYLNHL